LLFRASCYFKVDHENLPDSKPNGDVDLVSISQSARKVLILIPITRYVGVYPVWWNDCGGRDEDSALYVADRTGSYGFDSQQMPERFAPAIENISMAGTADVDTPWPGLDAAQDVESRQRTHI